MPKVHITATWGNDDAESSIAISAARWQAVQQGAHHEQDAWAYYEGRRFSVHWDITDTHVNILGPDGLECVVDGLLDELCVEASDRETRALRSGTRAT